MIDISFVCRDTLRSGPSGRLEQNGRAARSWTGCDQVAVLVLEADAAVRAFYEGMFAAS